MNDPITKEFLANFLCEGLTEDAVLFRCDCGIHNLTVAQLKQGVLENNPDIENKFMDILRIARDLLRRKANRK